jgi:RimJ/RimL family protein N-acetyltransferase
MSQRVRLREFRDSDLDALAAMVGDDEQMTFYPHRGPEMKRLPGFAEIARSTRHTGSDRGLSSCSHSPASPDTAVPDRWNWTGVAEVEIGWHHVPSRRVAEHLGMRAERRALLEGDYPAVVYATELPRRRS